MIYSEYYLSRISSSPNVVLGKHNFLAMISAGLNLTALTLLSQTSFSAICFMVRYLYPLLVFLSASLIL
jgi:hypothetical protein